MTILLNKLTLPLIAFLSFNLLFAQSSFISKTIQYDGETRHYDIYVPLLSDLTVEVPLVFNFHGGGGNIASQIALADMSPLADTAGFIVVYPQALSDPNDGGSTNWIHKSPTTVDDVFFIDALLDTLSTEHQVDANRIYACGYSLGGEFTYELGCRLNHRIAAIGVVARTMQTWTIDNCSPVHPTGIITVLGTSDYISPYDGLFWNGTQYYMSANEVHDYWATYNDCSATPLVSSLPNTNTSDGSTVEKYSWSTTNGCTFVEHLKVIGGGHDWPGSFGNMDINTTDEIWTFVSRYDITGLISCTPTAISEINNPKFHYRTYPNPISDQLSIETNDPNTKTFILYNSLGKTMLTGNVNHGINTIDLSSLPSNVYILNIGGKNTKLIKTN